MRISSKRKKQQIQSFLKKLYKQEAAGKGIKWWLNELSPSELAIVLKRSRINIRRQMRDYSNSSR